MITERVNDNHRIISLLFILISQSRFHGKVEDYIFIDKENRKSLFFVIKLLVRLALACYIEDLGAGTPVLRPVVCSGLPYLEKISVSCRKTLAACQHQR